MGVTIHSMSHSPEYEAWSGMKARCYRPKNKRYPTYGARGIRVCDRWRESFSNFYADMGPRPSPDHSIERIENDGDYEPNNCEWATRIKQSNNKTSNIVLEFDGKAQTVAQWARELGVKRQTLAQRIRYGWSVERALTEPLRRTDHPEYARILNDLRGMAR